MSDARDEKLRLGGMALEVVFELVYDDPLVTLPRFRPRERA